MEMKDRFGGKWRDKGKGEAGNSRGLVLIARVWKGTRRK